MGFFDGVIKKAERGITSSFGAILNGNRAIEEVNAGNMLGMKVHSLNGLNKYVGMFNGQNGQKLIRNEANAKVFDRISGFDATSKSGIAQMAGGLPIEHNMGSIDKLKMAHMGADGTYQGGRIAGSAGAASLAVGTPIATIGALLPNNNRR